MTCMCTSQCWKGAKGERQNACQHEQLASVANKAYNTFHVRVRDKAHDDFPPQGKNTTEKHTVLLVCCWNHEGPSHLRRLNRNCFCGHHHFYGRSSGRHPLEATWSSNSKPSSPAFFFRKTNIKPKNRGLDHVFPFPRVISGSMLNFWGVHSLKTNSESTEKSDGWKKISSFLGSRQSYFPGKAMLCFGARHECMEKGHLIFDWNTLCWELHYCLRSSDMLTLPDQYPVTGVLLSTAIYTKSFHWEVAASLKTYKMWELQFAHWNKQNIILKNENANKTNIAPP